MPPSKPSVLIVEDAAALAEAYVEYLRGEAARVRAVSRGKAALALLETEPFDVVVLDVNLPDVGGIEVLKQMRSRGVPAEVVVITAQASVRIAVEAMREGAFDFVTKPFSADRLRVTVRNAADRRRLEAEVETIKEEYGRAAFAGFIGQSLPMQAVYRTLQSAAPTKATVFVTGESGTGKELCAEALHKLGLRRDKPFVALNCAAIPRDLLESEIFGHRKGAFTGATADRRGAALQANGGTLFLDEICEMDLSLQAKMLRFLQMGAVQRVGDDAPTPVDVRIVCATNRDPKAEVEAGRFREDLFYRLHVIPVELPPLRDREDDVLLLARRFLEKAAKEDGKRFAGFSSECERALLEHSWPGNVRELQNVIRNVVVLHDGEKVELDMLPRDVRAGAGGGAPPRSTAVRAEAADAHGDAAIRPLETVIRQTIERAIARCDGSVPRAAAALQVSPSTLYRRIQAWQADANETP